MCRIDELNHPILVEPWDLSVVGVGGYVCVIRSTTPIAATRAITTTILYMRIATFYIIRRLSGSADKSFHQVFPFPLIRGNEPLSYTGKIDAD